MQEWKGEDFISQEAHKRRDNKYSIHVEDNYINRDIKDRISVHKHSDFEIFFLRQGHILINSGTWSYIMDNDQCLLILPGTEHSVTPLYGQPFFYSILYFSSDLIDDNEFLVKLHERSLDVEYVVQEDTPLGAVVLPALMEIFSLYKSQPLGAGLAIRGNIYSILFNLAQHRELFGINTDRLYNVYNYIEKHYMEQISISTLASLVNMSKYHFIRYFHKTTNQTPIEYINAYRIKKACNLLESQAYHKVLNVALSVGFNDLSYFNRLFKRKLGISPMQYRNYHIQPPHDREWEKITVETPSFYYYLL